MSLAGLTQRRPESTLSWGERLNSLRRLQLGRPVVWALLAFAVWRSAIVPVQGPTFTLDGSWQNAVVWAIQSGKQFGESIDFTLGPLAELDVSSVLSLRLFLPAVIATAVSGVFLVLVAWKLARRWLGPLVSAAVVALIVVPLLSVAVPFSGRVLALCVMCAIGLAVGAIDQRRRLSVVIVLASCSSLSTLTKFSNGILATATVVLIAALCTSGGIRRRVATVLMALAAASVSGLLFWLLAGQHFANLIPWLGASLELTSGYPEAMASGDPSEAYEYGVMALLLGVLVLQVVFLRNLPSAGRNQTAVLLALVAWTFVAALRLGFTRHDAMHAQQSFTLLLVAILALGFTRQSLFSLFGIFVSAMSAFSVLSFDSGFGVTLDRTVSPTVLAANSAAEVSAALSPTYRSRVVSKARRAGEAQYALTPTVLSAVGHQPTQVDPYDANVAWVYRLNWVPVPVFQTYSAYTPELDRINARSLVSSNGPRVVLRGTLSAIDGRNAMWESPRYTESLVCDFSPSIQSKKWLVLVRTKDRCDPFPVMLSTVTFNAGQRVAVPSAPGTGYLVTASLAVGNTPINVLATEVLKPISDVVVSTNQGDYRLPRAHAEGPLILDLPASVGWSSQFGGATRITSISINEPGTVTFYAVDVHVKS